LKVLPIHWANLNYLKIIDLNKAVLFDIVQSSLII